MEPIGSARPAARSLRPGRTAGRCVDRDERGAVLHPLQLGIGELGDQPPGLFGGEETVARTPGHHRGAYPGITACALQGLRGEPAVGDRQPAQRPDPHGLPEQPQRARHPRHHLQRAERRRQEVLVRVAVGEHQAGQPLRVPGGHQLTLAPPVSLPTNVTPRSRGAARKSAISRATPGGERSAPGRRATWWEPSGSSGTTTLACWPSGPTTSRHSEPSTSSPCTSTTTGPGPPVSV